MKLTAILLLGFLLQVSAEGNSQSVTLVEKGVPLIKVFKEFHKQTGYNFFYTYEVIKKAGKVDVNLRNTPLQKALDLCLEGKSLAYSILDNTVVIKEADLKHAIVKPNEWQMAAIENIQKVITGQVTDANGNPLEGVSVIVKGSKRGTSTDNGGRYSITVDDDANSVLVFSMVGYITVEKRADNSVVNIELSTQTGDMEEVVLTGYQKIERRSLTSSISTVKMDDLITINQPNIDKLLQGQVPGMTVVSTSGAPGAVPQIRIRGTSTISGNLQPLWVVDGIILDDPVNASVDDILKNRNLIASGIGGVNVQDIETISVLKDAAATAIYGTKAANGVVVITSKKGQAGKTRINFNSFVTVGLRPRMEDAYMMNSKDRIDVNLEMIRRGVLNASSPRIGQYGTASDFERYFIDVHDRLITWDQFEDKVKQLETVNTDWFEHLFRNSVTNKQSLSISGGNEKTTFYLSGSYMDEQATALKTGQKTYTGTLKVFTKLRDNIRVGGTIDLNARNNESFFATDSRENPYEWSIYTTRAQNAFDQDGNYSYLYYDGMKYNFLENRDYGWRDANGYGMRGTIDFEWKIARPLIYSSLFSFSKQNTTDEDIATENSFFVKERQEDMFTTIDYMAVQIWKDGGYRKLRTTNNNSITFRNQISYMPVIDVDHRFDVMLGQEVRTSKYEDETTEIYGYVHDRGHQQVPQFDLMEYLGVPYWRQNLNESAAVSFFGTTGYTYKNRYTISFNARTDGSNRFGLKTNQLFQPLWAVGLNYQMKEEEFLADKDWLTYLTFRGSYGSQGNVASQAYSNLVATIGTTDVINKEGYLVINAPKNPNLKWEMNYTLNLALEFGFFNRKLTGTIEYYHKKAVDLLGSKRVSQVSGFNSIQVNWASMENRGLEFSLSSINVDTRDFRWFTNINAGYNENKVLDVYATPTVNSLTDAQRTNYAASAVIGKPINGLWSYQFAGLNEDGRATFYNDKEGETVLYGMRSLDGLVYSGTTMPVLQGGFTNTFNYKKFTFSVLFIGNFGNVIRLRNLSQGYAYGFPEATQNMSKDWAYRWQKPGDEKFTNVPVLETDPWDLAVTGSSPYNGAMYDNSDLRTVKGDFVRLQNASLSYDLFNESLRKKGIQNIRFMFQGNNLHVWKNNLLKGQDPEATGAIMKYNATNTANVSFGNTYLPLPKSYSLSLSVQF